MDFDKFTSLQLSYRTPTLINELSDEAEPNHIEKKYVFFIRFVN